jgi:signal transduction histidine kinase
MDKPLRILLIDDDQDDFILTQDVLRDSLGMPFHLDWASSYEAGLKAMAECGHDLYLLDYRLGSKTGLDLLKEPAAATCQAPIILLTGQGEREVDLEAMKAGAADYLPKSHLSDTLERTIRHALERFRDRTALRQLNEILERRVQERTADLEKANVALQESAQRKDEFIAILAHELRNPLAPIANALELMKHVATDPEVCREARDTAERQLEHMVRLIDDLLEASRISRGKIELRKARVELAHVIQDAVDAARPQYDAKKIELVVRVSPTPVFLEADSTRLAQVIGNLLNNAWKFTPAGGRVELTAEQRDQNVVLRIRDNGAGIDPSQLTRIFDMFAQGDSSLERIHSGLGIGLTLVRSLVEMHDGSVEARSEGRGSGSEFLVRLPAAKPSSRPADKPAAAATAAEVRRRRILVVDDNRDSATTLSMLLRFDKHEVRCAFDGAEAVVAVAEFQPEVVLLDIGLPRMNGYDAARKIREDHKGKPLMLVAMTGWGQEEDRHRSREAGFDHHLVKPVEREAIVALLANLPD